MEDEEPPLTIDEIFGLIRSPVSEDRLDGLIELSQLVDEAYGEDGAALGAALRRSGGVQLLAWMTVEPMVDIHQQALFLLGNLCSDAFDPMSSLTKGMLLEQGGERALMLALQSKEATVLWIPGSRRDPPV